MSGAYTRGMRNVLNGSFDLLTDTIKVMLVDETFTYNPDHNFISQISSAELSGTGYTAGFAGAGRKTLSGKAIAQDDTNNRATFDASDVTWSAINAGDITGAIIVRENTVDADSVLIAYLTVSPTLTTNGSDFILSFNSSGIFALNV